MNTNEILFAVAISVAVTIATMVIIVVVCRKLGTNLEGQNQIDVSLGRRQVTRYNYRRHPDKVNFGLFYNSKLDKDGSIVELETSSKQRKTDDSNYSNGDVVRGEIELDDEEIKVKSKEDIKLERMKLAISSVVVAIILILGIVLIVISNIYTQGAPQVEQKKEIVCDRIEKSTLQDIKLNILQKLDQSSKLNLEQKKIYQIEASGALPRYHISYQGIQDDYQNFYDVSLSQLDFQGITAEKVSKYNDETAFMLKEGLCGIKGTFSFQFIKESSYYLGVQPSTNKIGLVLIDQQSTLNCNAWDTSFIVYQDDQGTQIESAETPGAYVQADLSNLKITQSSDDQKQKERLWTIHELDWN